MAFKMKRTPLLKGKLSNFFGSLGKKATSDRQTKQIQKNQGMTNFEKQMADKAAQRKSGGKSKFKRYDAERKANQAATATGDTINASDDKARLDNTAPKPTKVTKNINTNTENKNKTTTTTKNKVSYADAYKNANKKKYPTLKEFTIAAKAYNKSKTTAKKPKVTQKTTKVEVKNGSSNDVNQDGINDNIQGLTKNR